MKYLSNFRMAMAAAISFQPFDQNDLNHLVK